jgi:hypothetical protein
MKFEPIVIKCFQIFKERQILCDIYQFLNVGNQLNKIFDHLDQTFIYLTQA